MTKKRVELLAPAGNYACFQAALNAGADAIYIGGSRYGARAYADNFTEEEIISAVKLAHLFDRRVYLTVNTLVKNTELDGLVEYMIPYYEAGLDGVIIQDMGVFEVLKQHFPGMELHASTQMTLTGVNGARFLKEQGACRIVPARELSLEEIRDIKEQVDIDIESFIHGAMCYAYSGQCLFSSILGGRSGNRGRCAGPCRLPYTAVCNGRKQGNDNIEQYPLSLKDMYTLRRIPELIEAGIDSFKIEGRMKSPEYVAGVTSIYRKYIDQYYADPEADFKVSKEDENIVTGLYIRSGLQEGYYFKHNGKDMITIKEPGYAGTDESVVERIKQQYVSGKIQKSVVAKAIVKENEPVIFMVAQDEEQLKGLEDGKTVIGFMMQGEIVQSALKRPMSEEDIRKQFLKMGDTNFKVDKLIVSIEGNVFVPVKFLNELRRNVIAGYENVLLNQSVRSYQKVEKHEQAGIMCEHHEDRSQWSCLVSNRDQLDCVLGYKGVDRIYIDCDMLLDGKDFDEPYLQKITTRQELYLALPYIMRKRSYQYLPSYEKMLSLKKSNDETVFKGVLIRNLEELAWLQSIHYRGNISGDANLYIWNRESVQFFAKHMQGLTLPIELNKKEKRYVVLDADKPGIPMEEIVYGRIPMMYTANCTKKTYDLCDGKAGYDEIIDRYKNHFPVYHNCRHCYNIIYNTVPLSLLQHLDNMEHIDGLRLEFTNETVSKMRQILDSFLDGKPLKSETERKQNARSSYTTGHYKRGVE